MVNTNRTAEMSAHFVEVFACLDDLNNNGIHLTSSSMTTMGKTEVTTQVKESYGPRSELQTVVEGVADPEDCRQPKDDCLVVLQIEDSSNRYQEWKGEYFSKLNMNLLGPICHGSED